MTSPTRAEPNEHADVIRQTADAMASQGYDDLAEALLDAAAEIERLEAELVSMARLWGRAKAAERPWLPIESAPRDGTRVELWFTDEDHGGSPDYGYWECDAIYCDAGFPFRIQPTHWRPEPAGPSASPPQSSG